MKNIKSYSDHNIQESKNKILRSIDTCNNYKQIESIYYMINNFKKIYSNCDNFDNILDEIYKSLDNKTKEIYID